MPNLLLIGGSGLLAVNWARLTCETWNVCRVEHSRSVKLGGTTSVAGSLDSEAAIAALFESASPDLVVNCAGMTSVEACQADPAAAQEINVELPGRLAAMCRAQGIALVHISTDHLFDDRAELFAEEDDPHPLNVYGRTKAEGEEAVLAAFSGALVARTNFFGWGTSYRRSFSDSILLALRQGETPLLFDDVYFTPILMDDLVCAVHELLARNASGIVHVVGDERLSKYAFGCALADAFGLDRAQIRRGVLADRAGLVQRPRQMGLANAKMQALLGRPIGSIKEQLQRLVALENDRQVKEIQEL